MNENMDQQPLEQKRGSRTLWIGLGVPGGALVICLIAGVIIALVFGPWGIVSRLPGKYASLAPA